MAPNQHDPNRTPMGGQRLYPHEHEGIEKLRTAAGAKNRTELFQMLSRHPEEIAELLKQLEAKDKTS